MQKRYNFKNKQLEQELQIAKEKADNYAYKQPKIAPSFDLHHHFNLSNDIIYDKVKENTKQKQLVEKLFHLINSENANANTSNSQNKNISKWKGWIEINTWNKNSNKIKNNQNIKSKQIQIDKTNLPDIMKLYKRQYDEKIRILGEEIYEREFYFQNYDYDYFNKLDKIDIKEKNKEYMKKKEEYLERENVKRKKQLHYDNKNNKLQYKK